MAQASMEEKKNGSAFLRQPAASRITWSGRPDLNRRPLDPQSSTLTRLRHAPL